MDFRGFFNKIKDQVSGSGDDVAREEPPEMIPEAPISPAGLQTPPPVRNNASASSSPRGALLPGMTSRVQSAGANPRAIVQNETDDSVYQMRSGHIAQIESMFGEFGPQVCSYMLTQSLSDGGLKRTLMKLGLQSRGRDGADLALIENWILKSGVPEFCQKVGLKLNRNAPAPPGAPPPQKEEPKLTLRSITPGSPKTSVAPNARPMGMRPAGLNPRASEQGQGAGQRPAEPKPGGTSPHNPVGNASPLQKVMITPVGLAGKDVQRVHSRPAPADGPRPATPEPPPAPPRMTSPLPVPPPAPFVVPAPPPPTSSSSQNSVANEFMQSALDEDSQRNPGQ